MEKDVALKSKWQEMFLANYKGQTDEAKELAGLLKPNYKNDVYIPWAVAERMMHSQDPDSVVEPIMTDDGGWVHTQKLAIENTSKDREGNLTTSATMVYCNMVRMRCMFFGKQLVEDFPIQDNTYAPVRAYTQNDVNKAIKRAVPKVIARCTGLGLRVYEGNDLQYIPDGEKIDVAPTPAPATKPVTRRQNATDMPMTPPVEKAGPSTEPTIATSPVEEKVASVATTDPERLTTLQTLAKMFVGYEDTPERKAEAGRFLRAYNNSFLKQYGFTITMDETEEEMIAKFDKTNDPSKILAAAIQRKLTLKE